MINSQTSYSYSPLYKCSLLHIALKNNDVYGTKMLLEKNANPHIKTKDGISPLDIVIKNNNYQLISLIQTAIKNYNINITTTSVNFNDKLNNFLTEMREYMSQNNMSDDNFMKNLCDDITICILGLNSSLGNMYIYARSQSQGKQAAYNITNIKPLQKRSYSAPCDLNLLQKTPSSVYSRKISDSIMRTFSK